MDDNNKVLVYVLPKQAYKLLEEEKFPFHNVFL